METRINISNDKKQLQIKSLTDASKLKILWIWFILWTVSGMIIFSQFFTALSRDVKVAYAIWMAFWAYFEYKAAILLTWRRSGAEILTFSEQGFTYRKDTAGRGLDIIYKREDISDLRMVDFNDKKVQFKVQPFFWNMGHGTILFNYQGKTETIGLQLTQEETLQVIKLMKHRLNKP